MCATGARAALRPGTWLRASRLLAGGRLRQYFRILHRLNRRGDFLVSCRAAGTRACHAWSRSVLTDSGTAAVAVSSDSNPEEVGLATAAQRLGIPAIFIAHAHTAPTSPPPVPSRP